MPSRKSVGARQRPGQSVCSRDLFEKFLGHLLSKDFLGFAPATCTIERCREQLFHALEVYRAAKSYDANYILQEMRELHQIANDEIDVPANYSSKPISAAAHRYRGRIAKHYCATCERVEALSLHTRNILTARLRNRPEYLPAVAVDPDTLLPAKCDRAASPLPTYERAYCEMISALSRIGMSLKAGKLRPSGRRSQFSLAAEPFGPEAQPQPPKKGPERELEALLAVAWFELSGDASREHPGYVDFVQAVLKQVGSEKNTDADFLVNEARRKVSRARQKSAKT